MQNELKAQSSRLQRFRQGQIDRRNGDPCKSANGTYLDGWYSPDQRVPDFLTPDELAKLEATNPTLSNRGL